MISLTSTFKIFSSLVKEGKTTEAISLFYADNILQYENGATPIKGKVKLLAMETTNLSHVNSLEISIKKNVIDTEKQVVWGEMTLLFETKKGVKKVLEEAFFQQWSEGKITKQKFYYEKIKNL